MKLMLMFDERLWSILQNLVDFLGRVFDFWYWRFDHIRWTTKEFCTSIFAYGIGMLGTTNEVWTATILYFFLKCHEI